MISIVICTYNRSEILEEVLRHSYQNLKLIENTELLIVDNNSSDDTKIKVELLLESNPNHRYVFEEKQGLSFARNCGIKEATRPYILFLDDDALPCPDLLERLYEHIDQISDLRAIGGIYVPWYRYEKPLWFQDKYAEKKFRLPGLFLLNADEELSGGVMMFHKSVFQELGGFNADYGMVKDQIQYGEESEFQQRLRNSKVDIYGDDRIIIKHVVQPYKQNVSWFFKQKRALAKSLAQMNTRTRLVEIIKSLLIAVFQALYLLARNSIKLLQKDFFIQNYLIESLSKPYKWLLYSYYLIKKKL